MTTNFMPGARAHRLLFLATICIGSLLLFLVQPMIARMVLPRLGGTPAVWNSAMLVYQALLLAGYGYAHWLGRLAARQQAVIHITMFCIAGLMLPISLNGAQPDGGSNLVLWVPWLLLTSIGPLFFVVSAQAPLMQRWFALSGGGDPYVLYAASNLGSFTGLLAYPLVVEPLMQTGTQSWLWSVGYMAVALLSLVCVLYLPRGAAALSMQSATTAAPGRRITLYWIVLAAIASGVMLSTSLHLTTDVAAVPLLWVIPLGLYLLSFSVAFAGNRELPELVAKVAPLLLLIAGFTVFLGSFSSPFIVVCNLFVIACVLHSRMFDSRPAPEHLTHFYLAMSIGGVLGGLFCALLAPLIFDWTYEYPILLAAAALVVGDQPLSRRTETFWRRYGRSIAIPMIILAAGLSLSAVASWELFSIPHRMRIMTGVVIALICAVSCGHRILFSGMLVVTMLSMNGWNTLHDTWVEGRMTRSYFGIYSIKPVDDKAIILFHGTTMHGAQSRKPSIQLVPQTYYTPSSGIGLTMSAMTALFGEKARIGVMGLGTGSLSCYSRPGQRWKYYEIDPVVETIARDERYFTYISRCMPDMEVVIGDARLTIASEPPDSADLLVVDAFTSDAVPVHLLTREAFDTYRRHLAPNGLLAFHISNRFLDLKPVLSSAAESGWTARLRKAREPREDEKEMVFTSSDWVVMSPDPKTIAMLEKATGHEYWTALPQNPGFERWTDAYSSLLPLIIARYSKYPD
ncbi:MAG: fused MFS/spermidine synthase [Lysobacteraceae bacterium]